MTLEIWPVGCMNRPEIVRSLSIAIAVIISGRIVAVGKKMLKIRRRWMEVCTARKKMLFPYVILIATFLVSCTLFFISMLPVPTQYSSFLKMPVATEYDDLAFVQHAMHKLIRYLGNITRLNIKENQSIVNTSNNSRRGDLGEYSTLTRYALQQSALSKDNKNVFLRQGGPKILIHNCSQSQHEVKQILPSAKFLFILFHKNNILEMNYLNNSDMNINLNNMSVRSTLHRDEDKDVSYDSRNIFQQPTASSLREQLIDALNFVARRFYNKPMWHIFVEDENIVDFYFLINEEDEREAPFALITEVHKGWKKYILKINETPHYKIDRDTLLLFEENFFAGKLKPYLRTELLSDSSGILLNNNTTIILNNVYIESKNSNVMRLVSLQFYEKIIKSNTDSLVLFYAPWCGHSKNFELNFSNLANKFLQIKSIEFFKMDITKNDVDHPEINIEKVPSVLFFKVGQKDKPMIFDHVAQQRNESYGIEFLLHNAYCRTIDLRNSYDCENPYATDL